MRNREGKDSMFRFADGKDKLLMLLGTMGSIGDGLQYPLMMYVLSNVINDYGNPAKSLLSNDDVDQVASPAYFATKILSLAFMFSIFHAHYFPLCLGL